MSKKVDKCFCRRRRHISVRIERGRENVQAIEDPIDEDMMWDARVKKDEAFVAEMSRVNKARWQRLGRAI